MVLQPVNKDASGRTPYEQCMQSGQPVFALEYKKGRTYFACSHEEFCDKVYKDAKVRRFHEVLRPNVRTRIFMDFDQDPNARSENTFQRKVIAFEAECLAFVTAAIRYIVNHDKALKELDGEDTDGDLSDLCSRFVSHRESKLSLHVIFPFTFNSLEEVGKFVAMVDHDCAHLDKDVYRKNHSMRVVYSSKYGSDVMLTPYDGNRNYDAKVVYESLIQNVSSTGELSSEDFGIETPKLSGGGTPCMLTIHDDPIVNKLARCITNIFGKVSNPRCTDTFVSFTLHRKCRWTGRKHKNNRQFIWYNRFTHMLQAKCMDPECNPGAYLEVANWQVI